MNDKIKEVIEEVKQTLNILEVQLSGEHGIDLEMQIESEKIKLAALEKQLNNGWIPFKTEYDEDYDMDMLQGEIPDDDEEILVTDGKSVWSDTFIREGMECYLENGNDLIIVVKAWQPLPKPYKEEEDGEIN